MVYINTYKQKIKPHLTNSIPYIFIVLVPRWKHGLQNKFKSGCSFRLCHLWIHIESRAKTISEIWVDGEDNGDILHMGLVTFIFPNVSVEGLTRVVQHAKEVGLLVIAHSNSKILKSLVVGILWSRPSSCKNKQLFIYCIYIKDTQQKLPRASAVSTRSLFAKSYVD